jgi:hypothetical protein
MLAEMGDGVIGVDTHRDFHQVEIARPSGAVNRYPHVHKRQHGSR